MSARINPNETVQYLVQLVLPLVLILDLHEMLVIQQMTGTHLQV